MPGPIFISYASDDQETADRLVREIERRGVPCWIASRDIRPGEDYQRAIVSAMESSSAVLLLFSESASQSTEIPRELGLAGRYRKTVIPARLQDIVPTGSLAYQLTTAQFIDLFADFEAKVDELCLRLAEFHQAAGAGPVQERIARERGQRASRKKLQWAGLSAMGIVCAALLVMAWTWMNGRQAATPEPADSALVEAAAPTRAGEPAPTTSPQAKPISATSPQPQPGASASQPVAAALPTPTAAVAGSPAGASAPGALSSRTFDGVRFNLVSVKAGDRGVTAFVTATNISDRKVRLMPFAYSAPKAIDDQGNVSTTLAISGIPACSNRYLANCIRLEREWSEAYPNNPLNIVLEFSGRDSFTGSTLVLSFGALIAVGTAEGEYGRPTLVPVAFTNVPLKTGAASTPPLASATYDGVRFEVARVLALERRMLVHVIATNTLDRKVKLQPFGYSEPKAIDNRGNASVGYVEISGIPDCSNRVLSNCMAPDREWSNAYPNSPLNIVLQFSGREAFSGTSAAISFGVIVGSDEEDGRIGNPKLIPVSFADLPLKSR